MKPPESRQKVLHVVDMVRDWGNDLDTVVLHYAANEWHTVEMTDKARAMLKKRPTTNANRKSMDRVEPRVGDNASTPTSAKICWGCDKLGHLQRHFPNLTKTILKNEQSVQSSTGAFSAAGGQPTAMQPRTQPACMLADGNMVVQGQTM